MFLHMSGWDLIALCGNVGADNFLWIINAVKLSCECLDLVTRRVLQQNYARFTISVPAQSSHTAANTAHTRKTASMNR
jgi:hypothetical protein